MAAKLKKCQSKVKFDHIRNAERIAAYMSEKYGEELHPYRCPYDDTHFHIGHLVNVHMAIAAECQAIFNRGLQAGRGQIKEKYAMKKGLEYADKIIRMAFTGKVDVREPTPAKEPERV